MHWTRCNRCLVVTLFTVLPMASAQAERTTILYTVHADGTYSPVASYLVDPEVAAASYAKSTAAQQEGGARLYGNVGSDEAVHIGSAEGFVAFLAANYPSLGDVATNQACDSFGQIKFDLSCPFNCLPDPFECIAQVGVKATVTCFNEPPCPTGVCLGGDADGSPCTVAADCAGGVCDASSAKSQCVDHPERIMTISILCPKGVNSACDCRPLPDVCELQSGCVVGSFTALGAICECEVPLPPENFCIYDVACIDGSCQNCPFSNSGAKCFAFECIDTCTVGFTSTCGGAAGDCCLEMTWQGLCVDPAGLPPCPLEQPCTCDPTEGACCDADGSCTEGPESKCTGQYMGDDSMCRGDEACCLGTTCTVMDALCCEKQGGVPQGPGSVCLPEEPCCLPDKSCALMDPNCCLKMGGTPKACVPGAECCVTDSQCPSEKCRPGRCDPATSTCFLEPKQSGCCTSDAQCPETKCRRGICNVVDNSCSLGPKDPGCCETDTQCPSTKCRAGICLTTNTCTLGPKAPGCCETDTQCLGTKCRQGFCNSDTNTCELTDKLPDCCEDDAQCPSTKCRQGFCVLSTNTCALTDKLPGCCETDTQCPSTKCRLGLCDLVSNTCTLGPKAPDCCEGDAQCPSTKCRQGFCVLSTNTCDLTDKIPGCCETDTQCPGTKCRLGFCNLDTNTCELSGKFPGCCEGDAQCGKCETCDLTNNTCVKNVPNCCTGDAQCGKCERCDLANNACFRPVPDTCCVNDNECPGKCDICNPNTNLCQKGIPGCCDADDQCGKCEVCVLPLNTCFKVSGCCSADAQCGKCETCELLTNTCVKNVPGCCTGNAQCGKCQTCDLVNNVCVKNVPGCCTGNAQCGKCETCDLTNNTCVKNVPNCCTGNAQCGKCQTCDLVNNVCVKNVPNCCTGNAQCGKCQTCDLVNNVCVKNVPNCCTGNAQCPLGEICDLVSNKCVVDLFTKWSQRPVVCECKGDVDKDGNVTLLDLAAVISCVDNGDCAGCTNSCDVNCDGTLDQSDIDTVNCLFIGIPPDQCCDNVSGGEDVPSNLDWPDFAPNVVVADDWVSDGRVITAVRWWGSVLKAPDPKACPGPEGAVCDDPALECVCVTRIDGSLNCADSQSLTDCVSTCFTDADCVAPSKCFGVTGTLGCCAVNCGDTPPDPKLCEGKGLPCGDPGEDCICETRPDGTTNCADANDFFSGIHGFCPSLSDTECEAQSPGSKCFVNAPIPVCAHNCGEHPDDPKVCDGKGTICGDPTLECICETRPDGTLNCADANDFFSGIHGFCLSLSDTECEAQSPGSKCFVNAPIPVCAHNCGNHAGDPKACEGKGLPCGAPGEDCICETRPDGTTNCADANDFFSAIHGFCPGLSDADCEAQSPGTKCFVNAPIPVCAHNCGNHIEKACDPPGDSPFCGPWVKCGDAGDECHCGRHAPLGQTVGGPGVCLDKNQFADCTQLINCAGEGDPFCAVLAPGSKCIFDECCPSGWVCAHNCGEVPDPKLCPILGADCGIPGVNCFCSERIDGTQNCADVDDLALCNFPCGSDSDCDVVNGVKCFVDPAGINPGCCTRNCSGFLTNSIDAEIETASTPTPTGGVTPVLRTPSVDAGDDSIDTPQAVGDPDGWFLSFHQPLSQGGTAQLPALAVYFCDIDVVRQTPTTLPACDGHPVIEYFVQLEDCCLVHANPDTRYDPPLPVAFKDGFHEQQCDDYHLDIQAVVGTKFFQDPNTLECIEFKTNRSADTDFWGWHTTDKVCGKDQFGPFPALIGSVKMGPALDWLYGPWSKFTPVCSPPNMAFELLTPEPDDGVGDTNGNCVPDKCECPPINPPKIPTVVSHAAQRKIRYFSIVPNNPGKLTALRVTLTSSLTFPSAVGEQWWVGQPQEVCENPGQGLATPPAMCAPAAGIPKRTMWSSELSCFQTCIDWHSLVDVAGNALDVLHVGDRDIAPDSVYEIQAVDCTCDKTNPGNFSLPLAIGTSRWGDISRVLPSDCPRDTPDNSVDLILDCVAILNKFSGNFCAVIKSRADIDPHVPDRVINISDVFRCVNAFQGQPYPFPGPVGCP